MYIHIYIYIYIYICINRRLIVACVWPGKGMLEMQACERQRVSAHAIHTSDWIMLSRIKGRH